MPHTSMHNARQVNKGVQDKFAVERAVLPGLPPSPEVFAEMEKLGVTIYSTPKSVNLVNPSETKAIIRAYRNDQSGRVSVKKMARSVLRGLASLDVPHPGTEFTTGDFELVPGVLSTRQFLCLRLVDEYQLLQQQRATALTALKRQLSKDKGGDHYDDHAAGFTFRINFGYTEDPELRLNQVPLEALRPAEVCLAQPDTFPRFEDLVKTAPHYN